VVTGLGVVTALGDDVETLWSALLAGHSAIGPIRRFDASGYPTRIGGEISGSPATPERILAFARAAASHAISSAGLDADGAVDATRCGVVTASGVASLDQDEVFGATGDAAPEDVAGPLDVARFASDFRARLGQRAFDRLSPGSIAVELAREHGILGPVASVDTACAAGAQAIGDGARWVRQGLADVVIAGGADSQLHPLGLASFCLLKALSRRNDEPERASRPFDLERDGFVLGEGAGMLVLEELEHARRRGARIWGELVGFGAASDSYRVTDPHPDGRGAVLAMQRALRDAGIPPAAVTHLNAHGTSTVANDRIETRAIQEVFGEHAGAIAISSTKSALGHLTEAAGAVEAVLTVLALDRQTAPPTLNLEHPDPECPLDYTPLVARPLRIDVALSNSFGFGGQCAALLFARAREADSAF
jgi:3-oxoacyl-[acyl-carrier-protein] synthase II